LHNLYANGRNFGFDPLAALQCLPLGRISAVHLAGGRRLPNGRLLDDHLHPVPDPVFVMLEELGRRCEQPLDVILERDGRYPPITELLAELDQARAALAAGRARRRAATAPSGRMAAVSHGTLEDWREARRPHVCRDGARHRGTLMSAQALEAFLAHLYTDAHFRARVLADPIGEGQRGDLDPDECAAIAALDHCGMECAAQSYARKRETICLAPTWQQRVRVSVERLIAEL